MERPSLKGQAEKNVWTGDFQPTPTAQITLFCFPYAGGTSLIYRKWPALVSGLIDVCPVNLPGRAKRFYEDRFTSITPLVEAVGEALLPYIKRPYAFFGHSMGALIAFELAQLYRRQNCSLPVHLFVSGCRAPQIPHPDPPLADLPDTKFIEELRRLNGTPLEVLEHAELIQVMMPLLRADFKICETYFYEQAPPMDCPITAFGGLQDVYVTRTQIDAWRTQTTAPFVVRMLAGDHFFLHTQEQIIAEAISRMLYRP